MKNKTAKLLCLLLIVVLALSVALVACNQKADDPLATELKESLKAYLQTDDFAKSVKDARTTQARVPLLYLRYVKGDFYTDEVVLQFKKISQHD